MAEDAMEVAALRPGDLVDVQIEKAASGDATHHRASDTGIGTSDPRPLVTVAELVERYGDPSITEIDWPKLRAEMEEEMARDFFDELRRSA